MQTPPVTTGRTGVVPLFAVTQKLTPLTGVIFTVGAAAYSPGLTVNVGFGSA